MRVFVFLLCCSLGMATAKAQSPEVYLDYKRFYTPEGKGVFEVYLQFSVASLTLKANEQQQPHASVEVLELIKKDDQIIDFRKHLIQNTQQPDSSLNDFTDQQRFVLEPGMYQLEVQVTDLLAESPKPITQTVDFDVIPQLSTPGFSDVQLLEGFRKSETPGVLTKSGYDMWPYVSNFFHEDIDKIAYYTELYNTLSLGEESRFVLYQYIQDETGQPVEGFSRFVRQNAKSVIPVLGSFDIRKLPSGKYNLVFELRNAQNEEVARTAQAFQRFNLPEAISPDDFLKLDITATFVDKIDNRDTLVEYVACLRPIAGESEIALIDKLVRSGEILESKRFFFAFWKSRNPAKPEEAWLTYKRAVDNVNKMFSTRVRKGYETDRGAIFLRYGAPDSVTDRPNEPSSYPYQIWHYYKIGRFNNKRFVFYLPDLISNDYIVLHSDMPGEIRNPRWSYVLNSRNNPNQSVDEPGRGEFDHYGSQREEFFRNPR